MKMFIPSVGYRIKLISDWSFTAYHEYRNDTLFSEVIGIELPQDWSSRRENDTYKKTPASLPKGVVLEIDRVYIRAQSKSARSIDDDYDSVSFRVIDGIQSKKKVRFWAKLSDVNNIEFEVPQDADGKQRLIAKKTKISPAKIRKVLTLIARDSTNRFVFNKTLDKSLQVPDAQVEEFNASLKSMGKVFHKRQLPLSKREHERSRDDYVAQAKKDFRAGHTMIPQYIAGKIKTAEDYIEHVFKPMHQYMFDEPKIWSDQINIARLIATNYRTKISQHRNADGTVTKRFQHVQNDGRQPEVCDADVSDMWIDVTLDADGSKIVGIKAGMD